MGYIIAFFCVLSPFLLEVKAESKKFNLELFCTHNNGSKLTHYRIEASKEVEASYNNVIKEYIVDKNIYREIEAECYKKYPRFTAVSVYAKAKGYLLSQIYPVGFLSVYNSKVTFKSLKIYNFVGHAISSLARKTPVYRVMSNPEMRYKVRKFKAFYDAFDEKITLDIRKDKYLLAENKRLSEIHSSNNDDYIGSAIQKDYDRMNFYIYHNKNRIYQSYFKPNNAARGFLILNNLSLAFYKKNKIQMDSDSSVVLKRQISLLLYSRTHGFEQPAVARIQQYFPWDNNIYFGNKSRTDHWFEFKDNGMIYAKSRFYYELRLHNLSAEGISIGSWVVKRCIRLNLNHGMLSPENITIEKI